MRLPIRITCCCVNTTNLNSLGRLLQKSWLNPGLPQNSKHIFRELIGKLENVFFTNLAWMGRSSLFSSVKRKRRIEIQKTKIMG